MSGIFYNMLWTRNDDIFDQEGYPGASGFFESIDEAIASGMQKLREMKADKNSMTSDGYIVEVYSYDTMRKVGEGFIDREGVEEIKNLPLLDGPIHPSLSVLIEKRKIVSELGDSSKAGTQAQKQGRL